MANFMGTVQGQRGAASRLGSAASGIETHARGWNIGVRVSGRVEDGRDVFHVYATGGSHDVSGRAFIATVSLDESGGIIVERAT